MTDREYVESFVPMARFIASFCGPRCEVALHYLSDVDHSIIYIENGHLTGRKVGDGLMDFALDTVMEAGKSGADSITNYPGKATTVDGKHLRFSTYYIRNKQQEVVGLLNINMDITDLIHFRQFVDTELSLTPAGWAHETSAFPVASTIGNMVESSFRSAMQACNFSSAEEMNKDDKMRIMALLYKKNLFVIKGTIPVIAKWLTLSEPTVYRYLRHLKENNGAAGTKPISNESLFSE